MPKWGVVVDDLTDDQLPWGLDRELLRPAKTITDPVHGDIYVTRLEGLLIDSPPMQRLRRVRQLGTTHLVYPGATHSRFSHALGTLRAAQDLLDAVADNRRGPRHVPDLLDEWAIDGAAELERRFAEATVLARLGGLLHDLCHVPLGHTIEDDLKVLLPHDRNAERFTRLWRELDADAREAIEAAGDLAYELRRLILSKEDPKPGWTSQYPFVEDIVGNTICADLMDYLQRDHRNAGLPIALGHRFVDEFYVRGTGHVHYAQKMVVRVVRENQQRPDVITELVKYLRYRYELTERVLTHHSKTAADAMIGKLLEMWGDAVWMEIAGREHSDEMAGLDASQIDLAKSVIAALAAPPRRRSGPPRETPLETTSRQTREFLEEQFTKRSDDGLLEHLVDTAAAHSDSERWGGIGRLARAVLDRRLFKRVARADSIADLALASEKYEAFGGADTRRQLEQEAARFAGIHPGWRIVIWLPDPRMRLKVAEVLVDNGEGVVPLERLNTASEQIVDQHRKLWAVTVYAERSVEHAQTGIALSYLRDHMDLALRDADGELVPSVDDRAWQLLVAAGLQDTQSRRSAVFSLEPAAAGGENTFADKVERLWISARGNGWVSGPPPAVG